MASSASVDLIAVRIGNILFVRSIIQLGTPEFTFYQIVGKITPLLYAVFDGLCAVLPVTLGILILRPVLGHLLIVKYGFGLAGAFITILTDLAMRVVLYTFRIKSGKWKNKKA